MSGSMYGMTGMGGAGTGAGAAGAMSPQMMQMLMQAMGHGGMAPGAMPQPSTASPLAPGGMPATGVPGTAPTPMANYIGMMQHPMGGGAGMPPAQAAQVPGMGAAASAAQAPSSAISPQLMQMMQMIHGQQAPTPGAMVPGQSGVAPSPQMAPGMGGGTGMLSPGIDAYLRSLGMFGGATGGAPT